MLTYTTIAAVAYLMGSIPFGYLLVRAFRGQDIRETGSGNIGATNVARLGVPGLGTATLLLDAAKGFAAVFASLWIYGRFFYRGPRAVLVPAQQLDAVLAPLAVIGALAALLAIAGHVFPLWLKFRGGKGVATGVGAFLAVAPKAVLIALAVFVVVVLVSRRVSVGSSLGAALVPVFALVFDEHRSSLVVLSLMSAASLLVIIKHQQNLRRLLAGSEPRFEWRRS